MTETTHNAAENSATIGNETAPCVQCGYCSAYCEVAFLAADSPRKVLRFLQRNDQQRAATSPFLMLCKQCQTCSLTCPQGIDVAGIMRRLVRNRFLDY